MKSMRSSNDSTLHILNVVEATINKLLKHSRSHTHKQASNSLLSSSPMSKCIRVRILVFYLLN